MDGSLIRGNESMCALDEYTCETTAGELFSWHIHRCSGRGKIRCAGDILETMKRRTKKTGHVHAEGTA